MSLDDNDKYKIDALLREYSEVRSEVRTYEILQITCIIISPLIFILLFTISIIYEQPILIFISPSVSIFFILLSMTMLPYTTICGLRCGQIENKLKRILGESIIEWEYTVGIFNLIRGNVIIQKVGKYWLKMASLSIIVGITPVVIGFIYGFGDFYNEYGIAAWILVSFYVIVTCIAIFLGYRFYTRNWEKVKLSV